MLFCKHSHSVSLKIFFCFVALRTHRGHTGPDVESDNFHVKDSSPVTVFHPFTERFQPDKIFCQSVHDEDSLYSLKPALLFCDRKPQIAVNSAQQRMITEMDSLALRCCASGDHDSVTTQTFFLCFHFSSSSMNFRTRCINCGHNRNNIAGTCTRPFCLKHFTNSAACATISGSVFIMFIRCS